MERHVELKDASFSYGEADILNSITFSVAEGEFAGIIGPNGAGKSTLLKIIKNLKRIKSGEYLYRGEKITGGSRKVSAEAALLPQSLEVSFPLTVFEMVMMGGTPHKKGVFDTREEIESALGAMEFCEISRFSERQFGELSTGEQKRVLLARAIAQRPRLLLLDELTANLDLHFQTFLLKKIKRLNEEGMTVIFVSHDINLSSQFCDRIILLSSGRIIGNGTPEEILKYSLLKEVFGVDIYIGVNELNGKLFVIPM
ncbi:MAG: ABC transporter ATP-binding protein [Deltaproteobacteria bacterium]|nr:ABC transporter ATP-binding protein [Deltaproteobacteria bacterium]